MAAILCTNRLFPALGLRSFQFVLRGLMLIAFAINRRVPPGTILVFDLKTLVLDWLSVLRSSVFISSATKASNGFRLCLIFGAIFLLLLVLLARQPPSQCTRRWMPTQLRTAILAGHHPSHEASQSLSL